MGKIKQLAMIQRFAGSGLINHISGRNLNQLQRQHGLTKWIQELRNASLKIIMAEYHNGSLIKRSV